MLFFEDKNLIEFHTLHLLIQILWSTVLPVIYVLGAHRLLEEPGRWSCGRGYDVHWSERLLMASSHLHVYSQLLLNWSRCL